MILDGNKKFHFDLINFTYQICIMNIYHYNIIKYQVIKTINIINLKNNTLTIIIRKISFYLVIKYRINLFQKYK